MVILYTLYRKTNERFQQTLKSIDFQSGKPQMLKEGLLLLKYMAGKSPSVKWPSLKTQQDTYPFVLGWAQVLRGSEILASFSPVAK